MATNFEPANLDHCVINTIDEMADVFCDTGIDIYFDAAVENEDIAVDVVKLALKNLNGDCNGN